ncbi:MAG TPA: hypothetical protein DCM87_14105 [Planctomycetes bacterium]|nr:hypothetical protein [Planctomycetota bacterium]
MTERPRPTRKPESAPPAPGGGPAAPLPGVSAERFVSPFPPARLFCGCFSAFPELLAGIEPRLEALWGPVLRRSALLAFPDTRLYAPTMGRGLSRIFYVFGGLFAQDCLPAAKRAACALEEEIARAATRPVARPINLDPGLVSEGRLVLASTKDRGHRLPREGGVFEEITLLFFEGAFQPLLWTYPDFRAPEVRAFFEAVRAEFLDETREVRKRYAPPRRRL